VTQAAAAADDVDDDEKSKGIKYYLFILSS